MSPSAQISANQANSQLSTGPRTVLSNGDQTEFDSLLERYREQFGFDGEHESFLVEQMARSRWKLARIQRLETATFQRAAGTGSPEDWKALATLQRYSAAAERSYYKAHRELQQGRKEDKQVEHKQAASLSNFIDAYINAPMPNAGHAIACPPDKSQKSASFRNSETDLPARRAA